MKKLSLIILFFVSTLFYAAAQNQPVVQDIQAATAKGTRINIYWTVPFECNPPIQKLYVYRAVKPITSSSDLINAQMIAELPAEACGYTDSVSDYSDYYYAVIAYTNRLCDTIFISMNSTVNGVHLIAPKQKEIEQKPREEEKLYSLGTMRETPLPYLNYVENKNKDALVSDEVAGIVSSQLAKNSATGNSKAITPYFFEEDLISPDGGDDFLLFEVLKNTFVQEKYEESILLFNKLNGTNINESVRNRVYFYLAEAYFFTGDFEEAVKTFVKVAQIYPLQTKIWINYTLDRLSLPN